MNTPDTSSLHLDDAMQIIVPGHTASSNQTEGSAGAQDATSAESMAVRQRHFRFDRTAFRRHALDLSEDLALMASDRPSGKYLANVNKSAAGIQSDATSPVHWILQDRRLRETLLALADDAQTKVVDLRCVLFPQTAVHGQSPISVVTILGELGFDIEPEPKTLRQWFSFTYRFFSAAIRYQLRIYRDCEDLLRQCPRVRRRKKNLVSLEVPH